MSTRKKSWTKSIFSQLTTNTEAVKESASIKLHADVAEGVQVKPTQDNEKQLQSAEESNDLPAVTVSSNWMDNFVPSKTEDLAIHPKKVTEFQDWLQHCETLRRKHPAQLCLLTGPAGCGKTAVVRVLAEQNKYALQEWLNPVDREVLNALGDHGPGDSYVTSQVEVFKSFLLRASRYKSLFDRYDKRLLVVEDFPNALLSNVATFEEILENYLLYGKSPLVFIVADSKSRGLNISYNLFSDELKSKLRVCHIPFNAIATTFMQRAMKRFCTIMPQLHDSSYKVPAQDVVDSIVLSAQGDIRNALINLHFASLKGAPSMATVAAQADKAKGSKKRQKTLKSVGRDESINMLHALGRVFNPKYSSSEHKFLHNPDELAEAFSPEPQKFIDFVHANYLPHFRDIEHVMLAANGLSQTDMILREYRDHTLALTGLNLGVRSVMVANAAPISGWMPVRGLKRLNKSATPHTRILGAECYISANLYATDYSTFVQCIENSRPK